MNKSFEAGYQQEISWLKSVLEKFYPPLPKKLYTITGIVSTKGENFLGVDAQIRVSQFPLPDGSDIEKKVMKVNLTPETKIVKAEEGGKLTTITLDIIKPGSMVFVHSREEIGNKTEITAEMIQLIR